MPLNCKYSPICDALYDSNAFVLLPFIHPLPLVLHRKIVDRTTDILASWEEWWTYDGISGKTRSNDDDDMVMLCPTNLPHVNTLSGPGYWGLINPMWNMCTKGRRQSPINVEPDKLLFDPYLRPLHIDKHKVYRHLSMEHHR